MMELVGAPASNPMGCARAFLYGAQYLFACLTNVLASCSLQVLGDGYLAEVVQ